jgi:hypothetical protein
MVNLFKEMEQCCVHRPVSASFGSGAEKSEDVPAMAGTEILA